jgi:N-acetylneuraminate synthase
MKRTIQAVFDAWRSDSVSLERPYIIAEAGVNHEGDLELAKLMIDQAAEGGADAIKFQTYRADRLASRDSPAYWDRTKEPTASQYELFRKYDTFERGDFESLRAHCDRAGIEFLSTPFDVDSASFLDDLVPAHKISSSDITNKPFIEFIAAFGKPILLSTGASDRDEIARAKRWVQAKGTDLALLHCVLNYPTANEHAHLGRIRALEGAFPDVVIGYSDHTLPGDMSTLVDSALLGARVIEKHFTHDKSLPGNDHYHAMDLADLQRLRAMLDDAWTLLGSFELNALPEEETARRHARRSLVAARRIPAGTRIAAADLTWKRPAHGIPPFRLDDVVGRVAAQDIEEDAVLTWPMLR